MVSGVAGAQRKRRRTVWLRELRLGEPFATHDKRNERRLSRRSPQGVGGLVTGTAWRGHAETEGGSVVSGVAEGEAGEGGLLQTGKGTSPCHTMASNALLSTEFTVTVTHMIKSFGRRHRSRPGTTARRPSL